MSDYRTKQFTALRDKTSSSSAGIDDEDVITSRRDGVDVDILHLAELVPVIRARFNIGDEFPDDALFASLKAIAARSGQRERAEAAFTSNLGHYLGQDSQDLQAAMASLMAMLPSPRS